MKKLEGTFRPDRVDDGRMDVPAYKIGTPPKNLTEPEREVWNRLRKILNPLGVVGETDIMSFEVLVRTVTKARLAFDNPDVDLKTLTGHVKEARIWFREFGLTPASRATVRMTGGEEAEKTLDDFLSLDLN